jgi:hypothetical protein
MDTYQIVSIGSAVLSIGSVVIGVINHKRIRSTCCGRKHEVSLDIENTSPAVPKLSLPLEQKAVSLMDIQSLQTKPQSQVSADAEP